MIYFSIFIDSRSLFIRSRYHQFRVRISSPLPRSILRLWLRASATLSVNNWPRVSISDDATRKGCARTREVCPARASITILHIIRFSRTHNQWYLARGFYVRFFYLLHFYRSRDVRISTVRLLNFQHLQAYQSDGYLSKFIYRRDLFIWKIRRVKIWIYYFENI